MTEILIRPARQADVARVTACVCAAYLRYIERVGKQPAPMLQDYSSIISSGQVYVAEMDGQIVGVIEFLNTEEGFLLDSIAVHPDAQTRGVGRQLLQFAEQEAQRQGYRSIYLMTNEKMPENQALYERIGYEIFDRRTVNGYRRVLMRKSLS